MDKCKKCVLPDTYPKIRFNEAGVCNYCEKEVKSYSETRHFKNEEELIHCLQKYKGINKKYDVLVPLSGGSDSSNTLINIIEKYKLRPLAFHNDHGYENEQASENVQKLCKALDVDLVTFQHDLKFMKKLWKYLYESDISGLTSCYVCGHIIYLNAIEIADRFDIKLIINGYSKGQVELTGDKRLEMKMLKCMEDIFAIRGDREFYDEFMAKYSIKSKANAYSVKSDLESEVDLEKILVIPFYIFKFYKTDKEQLKKDIRNVFDWQQVKNSYPSRTTNCKMNWLGTLIDNHKMGYSLYEEEYAELIRSCEISRQDALRDLEFSPPEGLIEKLAEDLDIDLEAILRRKSL